MSNSKHVIELIKAMSGQANVIATPRIYINLLEGDINAAILLSQIVYWSDKSTRQDGWFFKSYKDWHDEIGLTQYQVKRAADKLQALGYIQVDLKKAFGYPTLHYQFDIENLTNSIIKFLDNRETQQTDYKETQQTIIKKLDKPLTKTTSKTTQQTTIAEEYVPPPPTKKKREHDDRLDHPAVKIYKGIMKYYVPEELRDTVIQTIGGERENIDRWRAVLKGWLGAGYNPRNLNGLLDFFVEGKAPEILGKKSGKHHPSPRVVNTNVYSGLDPTQEFARMNPHYEDKHD